MLRIQTVSDRPRATTLALIGDLAGEYIPVLERFIEQARSKHQRVVADLRDVGLVDRESLCFLVRAKRAGVRLAYCPPYVEKWICQEAKAHHEAGLDKR